MKKIHKNSLLLFALFVMLPLVCGALLYALTAPDTYVGEFLSFLNLASVRNVLPHNRMFYFVRNYLCDMLWAFALQSCIALLFTGIKKQLLLSISVSAAVMLLIEISQAAGWLMGTFDWWDILAEAVAILLAVVNITFFRRKTV